LILPGDLVEQVFLICAGHVRVSRVSMDGRELTLAMVGPGEILGEVAVFDGGERTATVVAQTEVRLVSLGRAQFLASIAAHPECALRLITSLWRRLRQVDLMAEELSFLGVKERLRSLVGRLTTDNRADLLDILTHQEIAEMIGTSRESVTRALAEIRRDKPE